MANVANTALGGEDNPFAEIGDAARTMQEHASRVIYLLRAMDRLADDLTDKRTAAERVDAISAITSFAAIAEEAATISRDYGETIERLSYAGTRRMAGEV